MGAARLSPTTSGPMVCAAALFPSPETAPAGVHLVPVSASGPVRFCRSAEADIRVTGQSASAVRKELG